MSIYQEHNPGSTNDLYLRLKDGDKVKMRLYSQPAISVYKEGDRPRYAWVVINHDNGKAQVYSAGISVYRQIAALAEDWGEPTEFDIKISRTGSGLNDTEYSVVPVKDSTAPTKDQEAEADKIDLLQATKGKWLAEYIKDNTLPKPVTDGLSAPQKPSDSEEASLAASAPGDEVELSEIPL